MKPQENEMEFRSARVRRPQAVLPAMVLAVLVAACTVPGKPVLQHAASMQGLQQLEAGTATLSCGTDCADAWRRGLPELDALQGSGRWTQLGLRVLQIDRREDLGYFYLGRAAEGLGLRTAALRYYRQAADLAAGPDAGARCGATAERCSGVTLPADALARIQAVGAARGATDRRRRAGPRAPGPPHPDAPDAPDAWIDPPPVSP